MTAPVVPAWITDPDLIASILDGHEVIPDEFQATPPPRLSPMAGLGNALLRLAIRRYGAYNAQLETAVAAARQTNTLLKGVAS